MAATRIGLVGAGGVAQRHASVLGRFEDVELVGIADPRAEAASALAASAGCPAFADLTALLEGAAPDAVYVCVPPFAHGQPERELIHRNVPFFVEKPLAAGIEIAEELGAAIARAGLLTATGYHWRYSDGVARARELLAAAPARMAVGAWLDKVPPVPWWTQRERSGGQVVEQATHLLDVMLDLVGEVEQVYAVGARTERPAFPEADVDDVTAAALRFAGGAVGSLAATALLPAKARAGLELVADGLRLELTETTLTVQDGAGQEVHEDRGEAKVRVDRAFVDAVRGEGDDVRAPYATALRTHRVACALAESARRGVPVDLPTAA
ncbi:MAG: oxidoreductase-like protein [uncultured Solirubrobacteraceae bacterium]|uniref:Oxidoreductase-like protein n=1 Tax=uncultured Solirubrobacteraceae bacterium TaxID=1162706 RepID=A0A6J4S9C4_9ACTN|nr:MAG: oxidoreductase-like protein [uncultured Solirubrobacteraceae bacterium]